MTNQERNFHFRDSNPIYRKLVESLKKMPVDEFKEYFNRSIEHYPLAKEKGINRIIVTKDQLGVDTSEYFDAEYRVDEEGYVYALKAKPIKRIKTKKRVEITAQFLYEKHIHYVLNELI